MVPFMCLKPHKGMLYAVACSTPGYYHINTNVKKYLVTVSGASAIQSYFRKVTGCMKSAEVSIPLVPLVYCYVPCRPPAAAAAISGATLATPSLQDPAGLTSSMSSGFVGVGTEDQDLSQVSQDTSRTLNSTLNSTGDYDDEEQSPDNSYDSLDLAELDVDGEKHRLSWGQGRGLS